MGQQRQPALDTQICEAIAWLFQILSAVAALCRGQVQLYTSTAGAIKRGGTKGLPQGPQQLQLQRAGEQGQRLVHPAQQSGLEGEKDMTSNGILNLEGNASLTDA